MSKESTQFSIMLRLVRSKYRGELYIDKDYYSYFTMGVLTELTSHENFIFASAGHADDHDN